MSKHHRHHLTQDGKSTLIISVIIVFICFIAAFIVASFVVKGPVLNAQFAAEKREIRTERLGTRDLKGKSANDYINYVGSSKEIW
jgi:heme/copper-type cytochrome/quinol oxidase subunit 3